MHPVDRQRFGDPLFFALSQLASKNIWLVGLLSFGLYAALIVSLGRHLSFTYQKEGIDFQSLLDSRELIWTIYQSLIEVPILWMFYTWQPKAITDSISMLTRNGVIADTKICTKAHSLGRAMRYLNHPLPSVLFLVLTLPFIFYFWLHVTNAPDFGHTRIWWFMNGWYFWLIWVPLVFVNLYIILWICLRQVVAVAGFSILFNNCQATPKPFNADKCNGFAPIGDYILRTAFLVVLAGLHLSFLILYPRLYNKPLAVSGSTIIMCVFYVVMVPVALILPAWTTHKAMIRAKHQTLNEVAVQIQQALCEASTEKLLATREILTALETRYNLLERELKEWPFRSISLFRYSISSLVPIINTLISFAIQGYSK